MTPQAPSSEADGFVAEPIAQRRADMTQRLADLLEIDPVLVAEHVNPQDLYATFNAQAAAKKRGKVVEYATGALLAFLVLASFLDPKHSNNERDAALAVIIAGGLYVTNKSDKRSELKQRITTDALAAYTALLKDRPPAP